MARQTRLKKVCSIFIIGIMVFSMLVPVMAADLPESDTMKTLFAVTGEASVVSSINNSGEVAGAVTFPNGYYNAIMWKDGETKNLGTLGGNYSKASGINDNGQIVGYSSLSQIDDDSVTHPFLWENGVMKDLGSFGGDFSTASDINIKGQIVGVSSISEGSSHAFIWENDFMKDLGKLGGSYSEASGINDNGQVVGSY